MTARFDVVVVGGGPGGYKCAELLGKHGVSVALVEKEAVGGTCLNQGCIPFKFYLHVSRVRQEAAAVAKAGLLDEAAGDVVQSSVVRSKKRIITALQQGVEATLKMCGVTRYSGCAEILEETPEGFVVAVGDERLSCAKLVIATGSEERLLEVPSGLSYAVIGSKEMLELDELPREIDIIGAGAIGLEAACYFADAGCKLTVVEALDHVGGRIDAEMAQALKRILENKGIAVHTSTTLERFEPKQVVYAKDGEELVRTPECVLVAIGRAPKLDVASLERAGVAFGPKGIEVDEFCRTSNAKVFACGDVTGKLMLAHTAYAQAKVIADLIAEKPAAPVVYEQIPRVIYSNPEVIAVGLDEDDCKAQGIAYRAKSLPMTYSGKYFAENGKDGAKAKMLVNADDQVIGFHMIGNGAAELSLVAELMIAHKMSISDVLNLVYPHPTYGEIIGTLAEMF